MVLNKKAVMLSDISAARIGIILLQLKQTNPHLFDEALIYHRSLTNAEKKVLNAIMPCRFLQYNSLLTDGQVTQRIFEKNDFKRFSPLIFSRFEMFRYLDEFETVMWIDTDVLIQGDLSALIEEAKQTGFAIYQEDPKNKSALQVDYAQTNFNYPIEGYDMGAYLLCSGLIIVNSTLTMQTDYTEWLTSTAVDLLEKGALKMLDQGTINLLVQEFKIPITPIGHGGKYGCWPYPGRDCSQANLIHAWGPNKFWNDWYLYSEFPQWRTYHDQWVALGGEPIEDSFKPAVSVVIPLYTPNLGYLKECLESILDQRQADHFYKYSDFEIILVAEPFEHEELKALVEGLRDPRITLVFNDERKGIAYSLNRGLSLAKGDYIARMDADDVVAPQRFSKQIEYLNTHDDIAMCVTNYEYFGDMNEGRVIFEGEMSRAWSLLTCPFDHPTVMFRKGFFEKNELKYDETQRYAEDWDLWLRAFDAGMTVGCIQETLLYHRWHQGSAAQDNGSNDRMKEILQNNFRKFGIEIESEYIPAFSPWWGKAWSPEVLAKVQTVFDEALKRNQTLKLYDQDCLQKVFSLRLTEAETGVLPGLSWKTQHSDNVQNEMTRQETQKKVGCIRRFVKRLLKPLYRPLRHRYEDRIINIQEVAWSAEGAAKRTEEALYAHITAHDAHLEQLTAALETLRVDYQKLLNAVLTQSSQMEVTCRELSSKVFEQAEATRQELSSKVFEQAEATRQELSSKVFEQAEATRQELSSKVFEQAEATRQELSSKVFEQAEATRQELSSKVFEQAEATRQELSSKVFEQAEGTRQELSSKVFEQAEGTRQTLSGKVYEQAENTRQLLSKKFDAQTWNLLYENGQAQIRKLISSSELYDFSFYINNRYGAIQSAQHVLAKLFRAVPHNSVADFGCGTGTWLWVARILGAKQIIGFDGDYVPREFLMIPENCFKPANLEQGVKLEQRYDLAISMEVAEHLPESAANTFIDTLCGAADVVLFSAAHPGQGGDGHINEQPIEYWNAKFVANGYQAIPIREYFLEDEKIESWYRENMILFVISSQLERYKSLMNGIKSIL